MELTRQTIRIETWDYNFSYSGVNSINELVMESRGVPVRSIIISTWRPGSSFLGDLLNAVPGTFYNYELLMLNGRRQIRKQRETNATTVIKNMLKCNFKQAWNANEEYFTFLKRISEVVNHFREKNKILWRMCTYEELLCYNAKFVSKICELFPFQSLKLVRYRLALATPLLDDKGLNVKLVYLVRDPRAVMTSRKGFCNESDCSTPSILCSDMIDDYRAATEFIHRYPDTFIVLRYEDLMSDLTATARRLLNFLHLEYTPSVHEFLRTHTNVSDHRFSTFRVSQEIPYKWKTAMNFSRVGEIQEACSEAMSVWGYEPANNASHMASETFDPLRLSWSISHPEKPWPRSSTLG